MTDTIEIFRTHLREERLEDLTMKAYIADVKQALEIIGKPVADIERTDILDYLDHIEKKYRLVTVNRKSASLRKFFECLEYEGIIDKNPMQRIKNRKVRGERRPKALSVEDIKLILNAPDTSTVQGLRDKALLCFLYGSGARREEAHNINLDDLSEDFTELHISHEIAKFNRERTVPLAAPVPEILKEYVEKSRPHYLRRCRDEDAKQALFLSNRGQRLSYDSIYDTVKRYAKKVGIYVTPHIFRHSIATHYKNNPEINMDIAELAEFLGHSTPSTTRVYANVEDATLRKKVRKIGLPLELKM